MIEEIKTILEETGLEPLFGPAYLELLASAPPERQQEVLELLRQAKAQLDEHDQAYREKIFELLQAEISRQVQAKIEEKQRGAASGS